jgi:hypothetical protein
MADWKCMRRLVLLTIVLLTACGVESTDTDESAEEIPLCPDVGCENANCNADGECLCPQADAEPITCRFG